MLNDYPEEVNHALTDAASPWHQHFDQQCRADAHLTNFSLTGGFKSVNGFL
ncbi:MAG: hypothetical protein Q6M04_03890 [Thermostichus sp. BF3_bins_97]